MILVLGLGNPGDKYLKSRHNSGFSVLDNISKNLNFTFTKAVKKPYLKAEVKVDDKNVLFIKPLTFMNNSGDIFPYFKNENIEYVIVCVDNMDLPVGKLRFRRGGASAGHNGLKSIIAHYGEDFYRLYVGVGRPEDSGNDTISHVLGNISKENEDLFNRSLKRSAEAIVDFIKTNDLERVQRELSL